MNKSELIEALANEANITKAAAGEAIDGFQKVITAALAEGERIALPGFGTFEVRERSERNGRNPQTGEPMTIPAAKSPAFKPGKALKEACN